MFIGKSFLEKLLDLDSQGNFICLQLQVKRMNNLNRVVMLVYSVMLMFRCFSNGKSKVGHKAVGVLTVGACPSFKLHGATA